MTETDTDGLTRVANRKAFDVALERALAIASVVKRPLTLFVVDIGDEPLDAIADALARAFPRSSDVVARYGRGQLAILLPDCGEAAVAHFAERLFNAVRGLGAVSAGAAVARENEPAAELVERAKGALFRSKRAGRNRWCAASTCVH